MFRASGLLKLLRVSGADIERTICEVLELRNFGNPK